MQCLDFDDDDEDQEEEKETEVDDDDDDVWTPEWMDDEYQKSSNLWRFQILLKEQFCEKCLPKQ